MDQKEKSGIAKDIRNSRKRILVILICIALALVIIVAVIINMKGTTQYYDGTYSKYTDIDGRQMHAQLYGELEKNGEDVSFDKNSEKEIIVILPALGVPSPILYMKPLAEQLQDNFNVMIVEPLGYGKSDTTDSPRTVENINEELKTLLDKLEIDTCILAAHSISGVYGLEFTLDYPDRISGFIALDTTVCDEYISSLLSAEQEMLIAAGEEFINLRDSFSSIEEFASSIRENPEEYDAVLPEVEGYEYTEEDNSEYIQAIASSYNEASIDEVSRLMDNIETIKDKTFPSTIPVLMFLSGNNIEFISEWESAHRNQLTDEGTHSVCILEGASHYIWLTHLDEIVTEINNFFN